MIDLSQKDELFFKWLEMSENDRGLYFEKGQIRIDWYKVFSKADSRLKIDENLKFKLFDWVTKNFKDDVMEKVFFKEKMSSKFVFEIQVPKEIHEKYHAHTKKFSDCVLSAINSDEFETFPPKQLQLLRREMEDLGKGKLLEFLTFESLFQVDLDIERSLRVQKQSVPNDPMFESELLFFDSVSPQFYDLKSSSVQRKSYSRSVTEIMAQLKEFYKEKKWQSSPEDRDDGILAKAYDLVYGLSHITRSTRKAMPWLVLAVESKNRIYGHRDQRVILTEKSDCKKVGHLVADKIRSRLKDVMSVWHFAYNSPSQRSAFPALAKEAYLELENSLKDELDRDMEIQVAVYYDQIAKPFDLLVDYMMRTYLPLSLFLSGIISSYQDRDRNYFLGFSHTAIMHHLAAKSFKRIPGQFPLSHDGIDPLFLGRESAPREDLFNESYTVRY